VPRETPVVLEGHAYDVQHIETGHSETISFALVRPQRDTVRFHMHSSLQSPVVRMRCAQDFENNMMSGLVPGIANGAWVRLYVRSPPASDAESGAIDSVEVRCDGSQ
jgi:hypothetical protein